jgi:hypothetical protein
MFVRGHFRLCPPLVPVVALITEEGSFVIDRYA